MATATVPGTGSAGQRRRCLRAGQQPGRERPAATPVRRAAPADRRTARPDRPGPGSERDRSRLRPERHPRAAFRRRLTRRPRGRAGRRPGAHRDGQPVRQRARAGQRGGGDGRRQAHRPAAGTFDLVHARTVLVTIPEPRRGARRDGAAGQAGRLGRQPGARRRVRVLLPAAACLGPAREIFHAGFGRSGADLQIGRRLTELYRQAGLEEVRWWYTLRSTQRATRAGRSCPTWYAACAP